MKQGAKAVQAGKQYLCVRSGKRLLWKANKPAPTPTAASTPAAPGEFTILPLAKRAAMPKWSGQDFEGKDWSTGSLTSVTLVNFWASWCGPCRDEWPALQGAAAAHPNVAFVGINTQDRDSSARDFLKDHPSTYPQIVDGNGVLKASLTTVPTRMMPVTILLDARGRIAAWVLGGTTQAMITKALGEI